MNLSQRPQYIWWNLWVCHSRNHRLFKISIYKIVVEFSKFYLHKWNLQNYVNCGPTTVSSYLLWKNEAHLFLDYKFVYAEFLNITGFLCCCLAYILFSTLYFVFFFSEKKSVSCTAVPKGPVTWKRKQYFICLFISFHLSTHWFCWIHLIKYDWLHIMCWTLC